MSNLKLQILNPVTRAHRQRHRRLWFALAVLLPAVFLAGLLARRPVPVMSGVSDPIPLHPSALSPR